MYFQHNQNSQVNESQKSSETRGEYNMLKVDNKHLTNYNNYNQL